MTFHADAIYEGGVLRPLVPLDLDERELVSLLISTSANAPSSANEAMRQRSVLSAYVAKMESRPEDTPLDGLSNRDHDRLIYGN